MEKEQGGEKCWSIFMSVHLHCESEALQKDLEMLELKAASLKCVTK